MQRIVQFKKIKWLTDWLTKWVKDKPAHCCVLLLKPLNLSFKSSLQTDDDVALQQFCSGFSMPRLTAITRERNVFSINLSFDGGGGVDSIHLFKEAKTRHFQWCLRVWSRGHQVRDHPCKSVNLDIFYYAKKIFLFCFTSKKRMDRIDSPP